MSDGPPHLVKVEDCLWICEEQINVPGYDFRFQDFFSCSHPSFLEGEITAVARMGAANDYPKRYERLLDWGVRLVHSPEEYDRTSNLPCWYPRIQEYTAKSIWFERPPSVSEIESEFDWPVFLKGERQTSRHDRRMSIVESPDHFREVMELWKRDTILHWQKVVCREYLRLKLVAPEKDGSNSALPKAFEFRSFWWKQTCVGIGPYWNSEHYEMSPTEQTALIAMGQQVTRRMEVTFLVIDFALRENGELVVIECNDGQDSGYTGVNRFMLWNSVVQAIRGEPKDPP